MKKSKLSIEIAQSEMVSVMGHLKTASSFREVDAIQGDTSIRDALRRTSTASTVVAEHAVDARHQAEAIRRVAKLRLAALLAPMTPVEVCQTAEREGVTSKIEAQQLAAVGRLPAGTVKAAERAVHEHNRQSKVQIKDFSLLTPLTPPQRKQAIAKLADVPTMREAVAAVCPTFHPKEPVIEAKPADIVPASVRKYQTLTLGVVAEALKLRGLVETLVRNPTSAEAVDRTFTQQGKLEEAVTLLRKGSVLYSDRA
jgi:hypothetical protein